ncbi:MAG: zinc-binding alcohol dehydrogenase family protein [Thermoplasmata archaeon]|nr:zinc-binding alcohol dehydrogenase family protein [Thermoplasmata archaeon]
MKAAVVRALGRPPQYGEFDEPSPAVDETLVSVTASAVSPIVRRRALGTHYTSDTPVPFVPGIDGVGRTSDGRRVYFMLPRPPFGSLAERAAVCTSQLAPVPDSLDDTTAAASAISGMSCWVPLTLYARIPLGDSVLVNGATGNAGRMAVQVAKHLGARSVIATGRSAPKLREVAALGADVVLSLDQPPDALRDSVRAAARDANVGVVLDYLWGPSAEVLIDALGGPGAPRGGTRVRYVTIGELSGPTISLPSAKLRSSGVEIVGTGIGSSSIPEIVHGISEFLQAAASERFRVDLDARPLADVESAWADTATERRVVFTVP